MLVIPLQSVGKSNTNKISIKQPVIAIDPEQEGARSSTNADQAVTEENEQANPLDEMSELV